MSATSDYIGQYKLVEQLGSGAMGVVWRAWDTKLHREVAIKEPKFDDAPKELRAELGKRFITESVTTAGILHTNIVTVFNADIFDGRPAMIMEFVRGETLAQILERGPLDPASALSILDQLLAAVGYAHDRGIIHRDIKPDNIFVTPDGVVKLADFGIAHNEGNYRVPTRISEAPRSTIRTPRIDQPGRITQIGEVLGTPGYMAPEQARGEGVSARSDLFSVGTVGYEMLTGCNPALLARGNITTSAGFEDVWRVPELPDYTIEGLDFDIRPAIMASLEADPRKRPPNAAFFFSMLHAEDPWAMREWLIAEGGGFPAGEGELVAAAVEPESREGGSGWWRYAFAGILLAAVIIVVFVLFGGGVLPGSQVHLAEYEGVIAIFSGSSSTPVARSSLEVSSLSSDELEEITSRSYSSQEEAESVIQTYIDQVDRMRAAEEALRSSE